MEPAFLRYDQVGKILSCSKDYVRHLVEEGKLVRVNIGGSNRGARITQESVAKYIVEIKRKNGSDTHPA